jgi:Na+/H+ antiporter NhaC
MGFGMLVALLSMAGIVWSIIVAAKGQAVSGWASLTSILCFLGGVQLLSIGIIGEYVGKMYLETKARPRYIIQERTNKENHE